jgi:hypothetical protein
MGVKSSPYQAVSALTVANEVIRGNHADGKFFFEWVRIRLNLPGDRNYDPSLPWVSKVKADGRIAADLFTFVDDLLRPTGPGRRECWRAARRAASILNSLGIQDTPRKRRDSPKKTGAWSGSVILVTPEGVCVLASNDKWQKAKALLQEIQEMLDQKTPMLCRDTHGTNSGIFNLCHKDLPLHDPVFNWNPYDDRWMATKPEGGWLEILSVGNEVSSKSNGRRW